MKIINARLNTLYDQYSNQENRLTHALLHTISSSERLFFGFLKNIVGIKKIKLSQQYEISTQKRPFSFGDKDTGEIESVPDGWVLTDDATLGIVIEVKDKKNALRINQLNSHINRINRYGKCYLLVITPDLQAPDTIKQLQEKTTCTIIWRSWDAIYNWLKKTPVGKTKIAARDEFLITSMFEYLERRREVLGFQGIKFSRGFDVVEAKDILNVEMEELYPTVQSLYDLPRRRPSITTFSSASAWDCFGNDRGFTKDLHITLGINEIYHDISLTVPNSAKEAWKRLQAVFANKIHEDELNAILINLRKNVPQLLIEFHQRHFIAQRIGVRDGFMEFNIDTLGSPFRQKKSKCKEFPIWRNVLKDTILNKKKVNGQIMFKAIFYYRDNKGIETIDFIKTAKDTVKALKPLYDFLKTK